MPLYLIIYLILTILGFVQGMILVFGLIFKKQNQQSRIATLFLILLILTLALENLRISILNSGIYQQYPLFALFTVSFGIAQGPLICLYQRFFLQSEKKFQKVDLLHFSPVVFTTLYHSPSAWFILENAWTVQGVLRISTLVTSFQLQGFLPIQFLTVISIAVYLGFSLKAYFAYQTQFKNHSSQPFAYRWLGYFLKFYAGLLIYFFLITIVDIFIFNYELSAVFYHPVNLGITVLVYWIGYQNWIFQMPPLPKIGTGIEEEKVIPNFDQEIQTLSSFMEQEKPYLNPELTLKILADEVSISSKKLTQILNQGLGKNFFEFINTYRVEEVKKRIQAGETQQLTLLGIAFEAGFNSKSAFNRIFKEQTGMTPRQFQQSQTESSKIQPK